LEGIVAIDQVLGAVPQVAVFDTAFYAQIRLDWDIAAPDSTVRVLVIHTEEDWEIARECWKLTHCQDQVGSAFYLFR